MNEIIAFFGTGPCNQMDILMTRIIQYSVIILYIIIFVTTLRKVVFSKTSKVITKILSVLALIVLLIVCTGIVLISGFGSACSGYSGYF